jgi:hypothetical protein
MRHLVLGFAIVSAAFGGSTASGNVTFHKDVLPVLQKNCQGCHRPGEAAPMSFLSYETTRPWAKAIRAAVLARKMPPWFADPAAGKFRNAHTLTREETSTLAAWADSGAKEGNAADAPAALRFLDGWNIEKPDRIIEMPEAFNVPASGTIEYHYIVRPTNLTQDRWVRMAEVRPGNRAVVHHVIAFVREPGSRWLKEAKPGIPYVPEKRARPARTNRDPQRGQQETSEAAGGAELLVGYAPGMEAAIFEPGQAKLLKAGSDIVLQMHWTANGKTASDQTKIGLVWAKEPVNQRVVTMNATNSKFVIPAGASAHQVDSQITLKADSTLISLMPHMHLRGKDFEYTAIYPTGERETLLRVPRYDFNWQFFYYLAEPKKLPKGTRIECVAHFDNSANNPANPDPSKEVRWGDQSWEEMMIGWFEVAIEPNANPVRLFREEKPAPSAGDGAVGQ